MQRPSTAILLVLLVALAARVAVVAATPDYRPWGDPADYNRDAVALAFAGTYPPTNYANPGGPDAFRPPAYPYLLAAGYSAIKIRYAVARGINVALGVLAVALLYLLARELFGAAVARWTAGAAAVFPPLVWLSGSLLSENLFIPLMLAVLLALARYRRSPGLGWAVGAGAGIGLATLTRNNGAALLLPAAMAILALRGPGRSRSLAAAGLVLLTFVLVLAPWTIRNESAFGRFLPFGTQSGLALAGQFNELSAAPGPFHAVWIGPPQVPEFGALFHQPGYDEARLDGALRHGGLDYARHHLGFVADVAGTGFLRLFGAGPGAAFTRRIAYTEMAIPTGLQGAVQASVYVLLALGLAGIVLMARSRRRSPLYVWTVPVLLGLSVILIGVTARYRLPVDPFLLMLAGVALASAWEARTRVTRPRRSGLRPTGPPTAPS